jgi:SAM-dependent methyltransferase
VTSEFDTAAEPAPRRLNWGCGDHTLPGWINSDRWHLGGVDLVCDIREGLPLESDSIDYAVSIHALPEIAYEEVVPALRELRRVLKPGATLRLALPDLERNIEAYRRGDREHFLVPDGDAATLGGKLALQLAWYGYVRTLFTYDFTEELLQKAEFGSVSRCAYQKTESPYPEIVALDNRERETMFAEAVR